MINENSYPGDISLKNRETLFQYWEEFYSQDRSPSEFFNYVNQQNQELYADFNDKLDIQCRNTLKNGYKQWAYRNYRYCLLYTSPSPRDGLLSRMPSSA